MLELRDVLVVEMEARMHPETLFFLLAVVSYPRCLETREKLALKYLSAQ